MSTCTHIRVHTHAYTYIDTRTYIHHSYTYMHSHIHTYTFTRTHSHAPIHTWHTNICAWIHMYTYIYIHILYLCTLTSWHLSYGTAWHILASPHAPKPAATWRGCVRLSVPVRWASWVDQCPGWFLAEVCWVVGCQGYKGYEMGPHFRWSIWWTKSCTSCFLVYPMTWNVSMIPGGAWFPPAVWMVYYWSWARSSCQWQDVECCGIVLRYLLLLSCTASVIGVSCKVRFGSLLPEPIQVRNTFIHFEEWESMDQRNSPTSRWLWDPGKNRWFFRVKQLTSRLIWIEELYLRWQFPGSKGQKKKGRWG